MSKRMTSTVYSDERGRRAYFAAANSTQGFISRYEENFRSRASLLYIIKGGPGTGKSRLMWDMVGAGERAGWQAELYFCSSDPTSLDAVRLWTSDEQSVIFLDGTAPHVMEASTPGVKEQLIDLGAFWSRAKLCEHHDEIIRLMQKKSACYAAAYRYLSAAGLCEQSANDLVAPAVDQAALQKTAKRLLSGVIDKRSGTPGVPSLSQRIFTDGLGMRGMAHLDTAERAAKRICFFPRCHGVEMLLLEELVRRGEQVGARMTVSYHPLFPSRPDAVLFEAEGVLFTTHAPDEQSLSQACPYIRTLSMRRMLDTVKLREHRTMLRRAQRHRDRLIFAARDALTDAAVPHFALEEIYSAAMDFPAKEAYTAHLAQEIFGT